MISNCCGANIIEETDLCARCLEHCEIVPDEDDSGDFKYHQQKDMEACER